MIPQVENIDKSQNESFYLGKYQNKWFERTWHYHSEFELLYVTKGHGKRVIGNIRADFKEGDLVLLGGSIPHAWYSDPSFFEEDNDQICESIYIQFDRAIFGTRFANLPEMRPIQSLLDEAKYGLVIEDENPEITKRLINLENCSNLERILEFIKILELFKNTKHKRLLSKAYLSDSFITKSERIKKVHEYVMKYYMTDISLDGAAKMLEMNTSAFCRFFKSKTKKTFSQYVRDIRIDSAQQLLINTELASNQIGFECGFSSIAYFNQSFKSVCHMSPLEYRAKYKLV